MVLLLVGVRQFESKCSAVFVRRECIKADSSDSLSANEWKRQRGSEQTPPDAQR